MYVLEEPIPFDSAPDATDDEMEVFKTLQDDNLRAQSCMLASMNKKLQTRHENVQSAYYILTALQELYGKNL